MPEYLVSMPRTWPWSELTLLGVGTVTHEPRPVVLEEAIARHLEAKGLTVAQPSTAPDEPDSDDVPQPVKGRKGGKG